MGTFNISVAKKANKALHSDSKSCATLTSLCSFLLPVSLYVSH
jgi:hypothetical protein